MNELSSMHAVILKSEAKHQSLTAPPMADCLRRMTATYMGGAKRASAPFEGIQVANGPEAAHVAPGPSKLSEGIKQATLIAMLRAPAGATIGEIVAATGWQPHIVRGAMSGALKKKLGLTITSQKVEGRGRCYHIA
ncbi:DUF3489 domain-containing protein [Hyphomonadaceae bacterium ML37]|nr:DUF3489 domain-containing protein [Hyphomonadaceae bacterium ML37]